MLKKYAVSIDNTIAKYIEFFNFYFINTTYVLDFMNNCKFSLVVTFNCYGQIGSNQMNFANNGAMGMMAQPSPFQNISLNTNNIDQKQGFLQNQHYY